MNLCRTLSKYISLMKVLLHTRPISSARYHSQIQRTIVLVLYYIREVGIEFVCHPRPTQMYKLLLFLSYHVMFDV